MVLILAAAIGLAVGSFANVIIDRVPRGVSVRGRSVCDRCRRKLRWWELVPIMSAVILHYRCSTCAGSIPLRYTLVEIATALLVVGIVLAHGGRISTSVITEAIGLTVLGMLAVIDFQEQVVPDAVSIPALVMIAVGNSMTMRWYAVVLSIMLGAGFFALQRVVSRGRWVGDGDTRIGAIMGAMLPVPQLIVGMGSAYVIGGFVALILLVTRRAERGTHIPLVPFLFLGSLVAVLSGDAIVRWYGF